ncbi:double-strand break repair protein AddB [Parasulfitobacter algicola]|uniref:Double-strand break repair protein AddB n=1 Tax=Parasulfitobacter algicola TaxID=2614809 RepID=A0ABX2IL49_9RHOB|nr:double-strand break repair protein AddB [Sulfitobacter algicola]NSX53596.1 double-strand break repair protein AddB [Sulfitobacter algicola]
MFDPADTPRIFGLSPGVDFAAALIAGLNTRLHYHPPEAMARVQIYVNTRRMQRRLRKLFDAGPPCLLPQIKLVSDIGGTVIQNDIPPATPKLRRRLELTQLIGQLLEQQPDLAPRTALYDLADSLADLMDEMQGEGVTPDVIKSLDVSDQSGHWQRALEFIRIVQRYFEKDAQPDQEARQRLIINNMVSRWDAEPPENPVLIAGSTGSRGATALLMQAVAKLPQGAVILPGFDFHQPAEVWSKIDSADGLEDHPQYRFQALLSKLDMTAKQVAEWHNTAPPNQDRNRFVSLALRPAPVTDQWLTDGPKLGNLVSAMQDVTLVQAPSPRIEALAIALRLRHAAETGQTAALITPDRQLARQVTAALDRWRIIPDDSAGVPLTQSSPGRFLLQIAGLFQKTMTSKALLALLKDPICNTGGKTRGPHLLWTRELELWLRRHGPPFPSADTMIHWASLQSEDDGRLVWAEWIGRFLTALNVIKDGHLETIIRAHLDLADRLARGPDGDTNGKLWINDAGVEAAKVIQNFQEEAAFAGDLSVFDYNALLFGVLNQVEVRNAEKPHPKILIWGTLEARVQGADLTIIANLNEGTWPNAPTPDPWLNRALRKKAGLLLPDRKIGLLAHDFQQAVGASEVWLTRPIRDSEAETVPSRWLNRIINLLRGLDAQGGQAALDDMCTRGDHWIALAEHIEMPQTSEPSVLRPSPRPPISARPKELSVTRFKTLVRDPYAIYAQYVLRLKQLDPLHRQPDAPLRGTILHDVFEQFVANNQDETREQAKSRLIAIADQVLMEQAPWPASRRIWRAKLIRVSDIFLDGEDVRRILGHPVALEKSGRADLRGLDFTITAKADRIDRSPTGSVYVYDYKTGTPPSTKEQIYFDRQLLLQAALIEQGAFKDIGPAPIAGAEFIGLGGTPKNIPAPLEELTIEQVWDDLHDLVAAYLTESQGFTARRSMQKDTDVSPYDQLSRFGEWDATMPPTPKDVR